MNNWYARFPVVKNDTIYFISGSDMFKLKKDDLEPNLCFQSNFDLLHLFPCEDEPKIACVSYEDGGPDIYIYHTENKSLERLTFFEKSIKILKYNSKTLVFASNKDSAFRNDMNLYEYDFATKQITNKNIGPLSWADFDGENTVFQKYGYGYINWKGYKGGTAGQLWLNDKKLTELNGNCLTPHFHANRVYFLHDNGKNGNIFSCKYDGSDVTQHTFHEKFHVQDLFKAHDKFIYTTGGEIGILDTTTNKYELLQLQGMMPHPDSRKNIPSPKEFLTSIATNGSQIVSAIRGNVFKCGVFSGGMKKLNKDLRFKNAGLLPSNKAFAFKEPPKSELHIFDTENPENNKIWEIADSKIGIAKPSTEKTYIAYLNHKHELSIIDYETGVNEVIFTAKHRLHFFDWSKDGRYIVYSASGNAFQSKIRVYDTVEKTHHDLTCGRYNDHAASFDPSGNYICFLSNRSVKCVYDGLHFDWSFSSATKPYLISLKKNQNLLAPWNIEEKTSDDSEKDDEKDLKDDETKTTKEKEPIIIDFEDIQTRIVPVPVDEKDYHAIYAINDSKMLLISSNKKNNNEEDDDDDDEEETTNSCVETFCLKTLAKEVLHRNVSFLHLSFNKEHTIIEEDEKIKILKSSEKGDDSGYKKNSILDLSAYKYPINPKQEWTQMMHEVWWLIKTFFWSPELSGLDWDAIWTKFEPYISNIRTRQELDDLINEIQGEVGTSHAFVLDNGIPTYHDHRGFLGCTTEFDPIAQKHKITHIFDNNFQNDAVNPLLAANCDVKVGDYILAINDEVLDINKTPDSELAGKIGTKITLKIEKNQTKSTTDSVCDKDAKLVKNVDITTLASHASLIYREWVEKNRAYVHKISDNKIGYLHIPDMMQAGLKEFFQSYLCEYEKDALIIDVRYNRGGNVSTLILKQLQVKRLGLDVSRNHGVLELPLESSKGAYVGIINAHTASDGEIFSHSFKTLGLGKLIGERTWGGVVGISPRYNLVDNTLTSQPEMATWFSDVGYEIENLGVTPDIEVINNHLVQQTCENDAQLNRAIEEALSIKIPMLENIALKQKHPKRS